MILSAVYLLKTTLGRYEFTQVHMGCEWKITLYAYDAPIAKNAAQLSFERLKQLDDTLSDYQQNSELNRVLRLASTERVSVSSDLGNAISLSLYYNRQTRGAFDFTLGPLTSIWRKTRASGNPPSEKEFEKARSLVGVDKVLFYSASRNLRIASPGVRLDFGGIAKGIALDEMKKLCISSGSFIGLIEGGGDLICFGRPPGMTGWKISIDGVREPLILIDKAVSTSGSTSQFVSISGRRYSHILDSKTGLGLSHLRQVTVIADTASESDPLATAGVVNPECLEHFQVQTIVVERK